ncbi:hypothetical protein LTR49_027388 [Elasticomyces elasticus]|nr:hypothetical protein LTR49_027388 [Elasticomyces elasticus]
MASTTCCQTALISGHTDLSSVDFDNIYIPKINNALLSGHSFILGDAAGVDTQALQFLLSESIRKQYPDILDRITIYPSRASNTVMLEALNLTVVGPEDLALAQTSEVAELIGVVKTGKDKARSKHIVRDTHMTLRSDYDILYVRSDEESRKLYGDKYRARVSATEMNRLRREKILTSKGITREEE